MNYCKIITILTRKDNFYSCVPLAPHIIDHLREKLTCTNYARVQKISTMFQSFFSKFVPKVRAEEDAQEEEELVDPQQTLRDKCREGHHAKSLAEKYQICNDRVNSRSETAETCVEELFDLLHAIDHCVTEKLFNQLK
ncbi:Ubiquinol-cytochrome c reductase 11 kDa subunit [Carabus blaptoides fortunei]